MVDYDFRAGLAGESLGADVKALRLDVTRSCNDTAAPGLMCPTVLSSLYYDVAASLSSLILSCVVCSQKQMDFVLRAAPTPELLSAATLQAAVYEYVCAQPSWTPGTPLPLCVPWLEPFLRPWIFLSVLFAVLFVSVYVPYRIIKHLLCGTCAGDRGRGASNKKRE